MCSIAHIGTSIFYVGICMCVYIYTYIHIHIPVYIYIYTDACKYLCVCMYYCMYVCMYVCKYVSKYVCMYVRMCVYSIHMYTYVRCMWPPAGFKSSWSEMRPDLCHRCGGIENAA